MPSFGKTVLDRGVTIPALDPGQESDFQLFDESGSGFGSSKKRKHYIYRGVMILDLHPDQELDFQPYVNSGSRIRSSKKWARNTSSN